MIQESLEVIPWTLDQYAFQVQPVYLVVCKKYVLLHRILSQGAYNLFITFCLKTVFDHMKKGSLRKCCIKTSSDNLV